jgi:translation initiation factor IF-3
LVDAEGSQVGVVSLAEALAQAEAAGLDLVEIAPQAKPPVAKIIDWGKYRYEQTKQAQKAKKKQKATGLKQIRLGLKIGQHDLDTKLRRIREFLEAGHKVRVSVFFRGREITHQELGHELLKRIVEQLDDIAVVDQEPQLTGKHLGLVIRKR